VLGYEVPAHGECAFCIGGSHYKAAKESARKIISHEIDVGDWSSAPQVLLPVLNNTGAAAGCGGCGAH
jgi:hypothetical protein